jgi:hypothetical protein
MAFTRTPGGLAEKWRFHQVPTVWLEGPTDIFFYEPIADGIPCRFEAFHGCNNARALIEALQRHNYPYLVILDGDYGILRRRRSPHRRAIVLPRYSFENLLWEPQAINKACLRYARCGEQKDLVVTEMLQAAQRLNTELLPAVILDVAARRMSAPPKVLPDHIDALLSGRTGTEFNDLNLKKLIEEASSAVDTTRVSEVVPEIHAFLRSRCITHLVEGHLLFGMMRRIFVHAANSERGAKAVAGDDALLQIFSDAVWRFCRASDHNRLRRAFRSKLKELVTAFT